ncbi:MAG: hypothetical protein ACKPKO_29655, partial [Candidatus Fonsibacter sp.]
MDSLSGTYKKAAELVKKSSKVALSLIIVMVAFLGFNSVTGSEFNTPTVTATTKQEVPSIVNPEANNDSTQTSAEEILSAQKMFQ